MNRLITIIVAAGGMMLISGCATTAAGLGEAKVDETFTSAKLPSAVATCAVESLIGDPQIRNDGDHYWIIRNNGYGLPAVRWDFLPREGGGTTIELRSAINMNSGADKIRPCL
jgi:hypothetical protein